MSPLWGIWAAFCLLQGVIIIYLNSYIVFIHGRSLTEGGKRNAISLIHVIIGINKMTSRFTWIVNDVAIWLPDILNSSLYNNFFFLIIAFHIYFSYWLMAWLCIYFSTFITNFSHGIFTCIKRNLLAFLPQVLFLTGVGSLALSFMYWWSREMCSPIRYMCETTNVSSINGDFSLFYTFSIVSLSYFLPFTGIAISLLVSMLSLLKHVNNIRQNGFNVQVHVTLIQTMAMFLILSAVSFSCYMIHFSKVYKARDPLDVFINLLILIVMLIETIVIIQASPNLRRNFPSWFCFRGTNDS